MKLNKETLKRIIKEELQAVIDETTVRPKPPLDISDDNLGKIHRSIDDGEEVQAQTFIDAFGGDPDYVEKYKTAEILPLEVQLDQLGEEFAKRMRTLSRHLKYPHPKYRERQEEAFDRVREVEHQAHDIIDQLVKAKYPDNPDDQKYYASRMGQNWERRFHPNLKF